MSKLLPEYAATFNSIHYFPSVAQIEGCLETPLYQPFFIPGLVDQMREASETLYLEPILSSKLELPERLLRSTSFNYHPEWIAGRQDSSQGIFFGELNLVVDKGTIGEQSSFPVAVKPYIEVETETDAWESALHEYIGCLVLNASGSMRTFAPFGVWIDEDHQPFLITHFEEEVVSLDNLFLSLGKDDDNRSQHNVANYPLQFSADALAVLHANGYRHGDAQIKNFATDALQGLIVDLTRLRRILPPDASPPDPDTIREQITNDLKFLIGSVVNQYYLPPDSEHNMREIISGNLVAPYMSTLLSSECGHMFDLCSSGAIDLPAITGDLLSQV